MLSRKVLFSVFNRRLRREPVDINVDGGPRRVQVGAARDFLLSAHPAKTPFAHCNSMLHVALAMTNRGPHKRQIRRGDLFDKRRELMDTWAAYATADSGNVVTLRKSSA